MSISSSRVPRLCNCQRNRENIPAHQKTALLGLYVIPSILVTKPFSKIRDVLKPLQELYADDLQDGSITASMVHEMEGRERRTWNGSTSKNAGIHPTSLFLLYILLHILCTLPVTLCSSERSFSALKCIKIFSMTTESLTSLTLLHIHQDIPVDISETIDERHPRQLRLANILTDS